MRVTDSSLSEHSSFSQPVLLSLVSVDSHDPIPTRNSLLAGIKNLSDDDRWNEFYRTYNGLLLGVARRAGLKDSEAQDCVQEVLLEVAAKIPGFSYRPEKDSFKGWLLQVCRWKVADQFRKRSAEVSITITPPTGSDSNKVQPSENHFDQIWDAEWNAFRLQQALARVKRMVNPHHYTIYHLYVIEGKSVADVKRILSVSTPAIYLAKHRVGAALRRELQRSFVV